MEIHLQTDHVVADLIFLPLNRIFLYYPVGQKFARNRSIAYSFRDIHTFSFSAKIQDGRQKL